MQAGRGRWRILSISALLAAVLCLPLEAAPAPTLRIGYSDWPGWVAWQVAIDKGWLQAAGLNVDFEWFDYSASMDAFAAGKLDGDLVTNGDALVLGASGTRNVMILPTDYSNGNDMVIGKPGIHSLKELKGRKVGLEMGLVEHLLLLDGLKNSAMQASDVTLVNVKTNETPQVLASGQVDAIAAWQPNAGLAMRALPGAHPIYTSAQSPGLIYDVLAVSPASLAAHRADYQRLIGVWDRIVHYIADPATRDDAVRIMAGRVGLSGAQYQAILAGTHLIDLKEAQGVMSKGEALSSLYGSSRNADQFFVANSVYVRAQNIDGGIDPALVRGQH